MEQRKLTKLKVVNGLLFLSALTGKPALIFAVCAAGAVASVLEIWRTKRIAFYAIPLAFYSFAVLDMFPQFLYH